MKSSFHHFRVRAIRAFRDLPIRRKLVLIIMGITTAALLLSGIGLIALDSIFFRGLLTRDLSALGQITADNSTAALAFNDPHAAAETLAALKARTHMMRAHAFSAGRHGVRGLLARRRAAACPQAGLRNGDTFTGRAI